MCVATVRGALTKLPGVAGLEITKGDRDFTVSFDDTKVQVDAMLAALAAAGEPAKPKQ